MASFDTAQLKTYLNSTGLQQQFPALFNLLNTLIDNVDGLSNDLITVQSVLNPGGSVSVPSDVQNFNATINPTNVAFNWSQSDIGDIYEIRQGNDWDTASFITRTVGLSAVIDPLLVGTYTFLIKSINSAGTYSANASSVSVTINPITGLVLTVAVIDNTVTFGWNIPTSQFAIDHYIIKKNGSSLGIAHVTFLSYIEQAGGTNTYTVQAVDVAGNISSLTSGSTVLVTVQTPSDYILKLKLTDDFTGTFTDAILDRNQSVLLPVITPQTWAEHFTVNGWNTIQEQVNAGYEIYIEPAALVGSYQQTFDCGEVFSDTLIQLFISKNPIVGNVTLSYLVESSLDGISWTSQGTASSVFISDSFQYLRITITGTGDDDKSLLEITSFIVELFIRTLLDSGSANIFGDDVGGTLVDYNVAFQDVVSITVSPSIVQPMYLIVNSFDLSGFHVSAFDASGNRIDTTIDWKAVGVLNS